MNLSCIFVDASEFKEFSVTLHASTGSYERHKITNMQHVRTKATCEMGSTSHWELVTYSGDNYADSTFYIIIDYVHGGTHINRWWRSST